MEGSAPSTPDQSASAAGGSPRLSCAVIRHVEIEDLGFLGPALAEGGIDFRYVDAASLPTTIDEQALIVLGGPMGAYEADRFPYLTAEIELIRRFLDNRWPVLGICLGAQLLAIAADGSAYTGERGREIGWAAVSLNDDGRQDLLWNGFPRSFTAFHWHGDTVQLPADARPLARSERYVQAFAIGHAAYGVQFHPEVDPERLEDWIRAYRLELERERLPVETVLRVPDAGQHRRLASRFGANVALWLRAMALADR